MAFLLPWLTLGLWVPSTGLARLLSGDAPLDDGARLLAAVLGSALSLTWLGLARRGGLARERAIAAGMVGLLLGFGLHPAEGELLHGLHGLALLVAALGLGEAFADVLAARIRDRSVVLTAALCLGLFDVWSVLRGPAGNATSGGLLEALLLEWPVPGGWLPFLGVSDLIFTVLLAGLVARWRGSSLAGVLAGAGGIAFSLAVAATFRRPTPALPPMGLLFCLLAWERVRPDTAGWRRTGRWLAGTAALLVLVDLVLRLRGR